MTPEQADKIIMLLQSIDEKVSREKLVKKSLYKGKISIHDYLTKKYGKPGNHHKGKRK